MKAAKPSNLPPSSRTRLHTVLVTVIVTLAYAGAMIFTNTRFTLLDDESLIVAAAAHPVIPTVKLFLAGGWQHEHLSRSNTDALLAGTQSQCSCSPQ